MFSLCQLPTIHHAVGELDRQNGLHVCVCEPCDVLAICPECALIALVSEYVLVFWLLMKLFTCFQFLIISLCIYALGSLGPVFMIL